MWNTSMPVLAENCWIVKSLKVCNIGKKDWNNGVGNTTKSVLMAPVATFFPVFMLDNINPQR